MHPETPPVALFRTDLGASNHGAMTPARCKPTMEWASQQLASRHTGATPPELGMRWCPGRGDLCDQAPGPGHLLVGGGQPRVLLVLNAVAEMQTGAERRVEGHVASRVVPTAG